MISSHIEATCYERNAYWIIIWTVIAGSSYQQHFMFSRTYHASLPQLLSLKSCHGLPSHLRYLDRILRTRER
jgi:hypothetical protein